ncbi:acyl-CoA-binding protein [Muricauda sp. JGD-17]|uniref:Acyl-CoA-binding protein n=1 Tax=Flagellimonas ochracea TaxID=2696472 RepID=A0A964TCV4_9FLAO|nr:acyl-CoA-binding protein [Allomuricauda ochracea]NAY92507.1 acyl-CoA-binding protein [Allomuricauda ochracea]
MIDEELHKKFREAVDFVSSYTEPLPADLLLKLYAYYKIANQNYNNPGSKTPLINAFKANALIQAQNINKEDAMRSYVELVNNEVKKL